MTLLLLGDSSQQSLRFLVNQEETCQLNVVEAPQPSVPIGQAAVLTYDGQGLFVRVLADSGENLSMMKRSIFEQIPSMGRRFKFSLERGGSGGKVDKTATFCVMFSGFTQAITCAVVVVSQMYLVSDIIKGLDNDLEVVDVKQRGVSFREGTSQVNAANLSPLDKPLTVYQNVFYKEDEVSVSTRPPVYFDVIPGAKVSRIPPRHRSQEEEQMIEEEVQRFIKKRWVKPSMSPWSFPFVFANGKNGR